MAIDYDKVDLLTQLDSTRRGWQDCEAELADIRAKLAAATERAEKAERDIALIAECVENDDCDHLPLVERVAGMRDSLMLMIGKWMDGKKVEAERDTLRDRAKAAEAERDALRAKWKREECAHCDERPGGYEGTIWCQECFMWWVAQHDLDAIKADRDALAAELREARQEVLRLQQAYAASVQDIAKKSRELYESGRRISNQRKHLAELEKRVRDLQAEIDARDNSAVKMLKAVAAEVEASDARDRRMKALGAADVIELNAANEQMTGAFAAKYLRDRADAIAAERDHLADVGKKVEGERTTEESKGE